MEYNKDNRYALKVLLAHLKDKYKILVKMSEESQPTLYTVYANMLEDIESIDEYCRTRGKY